MPVLGVLNDRVSRRQPSGSGRPTALRLVSTCGIRWIVVRVKATCSVVGDRHCFWLCARHGDRCFVDNGYASGSLFSADCVLPRTRAFAAVRIVSLHELDTLRYRRPVVGARLASLFELGCTILLAVMAGRSGLDAGERVPAVSSR